MFFDVADGNQNTTITYTYDEDGNRISEIGKIGTDKVEKYYEYTVENRLAAVYDADELLMAVAYDGDGNRVFQLNYNLHTDEDWKGNSGNGNGNNKDNAGSGNNGKGNSKGNSKSEGTDDAGYGNATNAEENNSQNQSGILFPTDEEVSETEQFLIDQIKTTGKEKNYELIEYLNDVNREYVEVLVEQNINGKTDTSYIYGVNRLSLDRFDGSTGYYLYDPRGSVTGITNGEGQIYQSYRYSVTGEITFGAPQYENEYTYNGESYNPNIESQYLRARYYNVVTATFLTEDSYLGNINEPLTLNRYNYCVSSYLNYRDPSGNNAFTDWLKSIWDWMTGNDIPEFIIVEGEPIPPTSTTAPNTTSNVPSIPMENGKITAGIADILNKEHGKEYYVEQYKKALELEDKDYCEQNSEVEKEISSKGIYIIEVPNRTEQVKFLKSILEGAVKEDIHNGIPWQVTLAQAALETGWGKTEIIDIYTGTKSNNLFGIKYFGSPQESEKYVRAWTTENIEEGDLEYWKKEHARWAMEGEVLVQISREDKEIQIKVIQPFKVFDSPYESIEAHSNVLGSKYYEEASKYIDNAYLYAEKIAPVYATDTDYADSLIQIIDKYMQWDEKEDEKASSK